MPRFELHNLEGIGQCLTFHCPGCECTHYFELDTGRWTWNGDIEKPTCSPSLFNHVPPKCHLWLQNGELKFLRDCEHSLAGTTQVPPEDQ